MTTKVFSVQAECRSCDGTGLYVGTAERDGFAVVCATCRGSGCEVIRVGYTPFSGRKPRPGVVRVVRVNPGIVMGVGEHCGLHSFGGIAYDAWERGEEFPPGSEDREHTCPAWFYQTADSARKPRWNDTHRRCTLGGAFYECPHFGERGGCWERWDAEFGSPPNDDGT